MLSKESVAQIKVRVLANPSLFFWMVAIPELVAEMSECVRVAQAQNLYLKGWGGAGNGLTPTEYLATIPKIPEDFYLPEKVRNLPVDLYGNRVFDRIFLVDTSRYSADTDSLWEAAGIGKNRHFEGFKPVDSYREGQSIAWVLGQAGFRYENTRPERIRKNFHPEEIAGSASEIPFLFMQDPKIIFDSIKFAKHGVDCSGTHDLLSTHPRIPCLSKWGNNRRATFGPTSARGKDPRCGSWTRYLRPSTLVGEFL